MTWTSEKPTVAGWYWMRAPKCGWRDCVLWVDQDDDGFYIDVGDCDTEYVTDIDAEWLGPISPTDRQQGRVAGLREAEDYAERCVKERQLQLLNLGDQAALDPNDRRPGWIRCKASEARRIQVWCARQTQQAQQAQDEKGVGNANIKMS